MAIELGGRWWNNNINNMILVDETTKNYPHRSQLKNCQPPRSKNLQPLSALQTVANKSHLLFRRGQSHVSNKDLSVVSTENAKKQPACNGI